jgi:hypothetical protein
MDVSSVYFFGQQTWIESDAGAVHPRGVGSLEDKISSRS